MPMSPQRVVSDRTVSESAAHAAEVTAPGTASGEVTAVASEGVMLPRHEFERWCVALPVEGAKWSLRSEIPGLDVPPHSQDGRELLDVVHATARRRLATLLAEVNRTGEGASAVCRLAGEGDRHAFISLRRAAAGRASSCFVAELFDATRARLDDIRRGLDEKMDAVARLADALCRTLNDHCAVTSGNAELLTRELAQPGETGASAEAYAEEIRRASGRCRATVRELSDLARRRPTQGARVELNARLEAMHRMVDLVAGQNVEVETVLDGRVGAVRLSAEELETIVMNLVANARDAMSSCDRGELQLSTVSVPATSNEADVLADATGGRPSSWVRLRVRDSGCGISADDLERVFEPHFTRKAGQGARGLGLSTVYGIVRRAGGQVRLNSASNQGTVVEIYLPEDEASAERESQDSRSAELAARHTVLFVEDEDQVRALTRAQMERGGYRVITARSGSEALELLARHADEIDALVTDIMMPGMNGVELASRMVQLRPALPVLFVSGYANATIPEQGPLAQARFVPKPFSMGELLEAIAELCAPPVRVIDG